MRSCRAARFMPGGLVSNRFSTLVIVWVPVKPPTRVSCFWRLLIFARWPGRTPFGGAENSPIAFICELKKQVGRGLVLLSQGQSAISDRSRVAHGISNPTRLEMWEAAPGRRPPRRVLGVPRSPETRQFQPLNFEQTALIHSKASPAEHKNASPALAPIDQHTRQPAQSGLTGGPSQPAGGPFGLRPQSGSQNKSTSATCDR